MLETSSSNIILKRWANKMTTKTANVIADQNQTARGMLSVTLNV